MVHYSCSMCQGCYSYISTWCSIRVACVKNTITSPKNSSEITLWLLKARIGDNLQSVHMGKRVFSPLCKSSMNKHPICNAPKIKSTRLHIILYLSYLIIL